MTHDSSKDTITPKSWLITGGCGFIGTALIKKLQEEGGHRIRVLDNFSVGSEKDLSTVCEYKILDPKKEDIESFENKIVQIIPGDVIDQMICIECSKGVDVIVHLAANTGVGPSVEDPRADMESNVIGIFNMLEAARINNVRRFIFASSGAPVGECEPPIHEELAPHPVSPYGASKLAGEGYCSAYFRTFGIETISLRFGNVYGPGSGHKNSVVAKFIRQAMQGEALEIYGNGRQTRDFIYIDDLISALQLAVITPGIGGEVFQIATNEETTVSELVEKLIHVMKKAGIQEPTLINGPKRLGDVMRNYSDTSKAQRTLNWQCLYDLEKGLRETVCFFQ